MCPKPRVGALINVLTLFICKKVLSLGRARHAWSNLLGLQKGYLGP